MSGANQARDELHRKKLPAVHGALRRGAPCRSAQCPHSEHVVTNNMGCFIIGPASIRPALAAVRRATTGQANVEPRRAAIP